MSFLRDDLLLWDIFWINYNGKKRVQSLIANILKTKKGLKHFKAFLKIDVCRIIMVEFYF